VLHGDTLIVCWDHEGDSFLYAFDKRTGKERWKVARDEKTSWSTPLVVEHEGKPQVVISATKRVRSYDLATGALLWQCAGLSRNVVSSPVAGHGMVFAGNSYDWQSMLAIRLAGASGDITDTAQVAWKLNRLTPYVSSPLLCGDTLYFLRHNQNILSRMEPETGIRIPTEMRDRNSESHSKRLNGIGASHSSRQPRTAGESRLGRDGQKRPGGSPKFRNQDSFKTSHSEVEREAGGKETLDHLSPLDARK
jgi:hypothetical protein